MKYSWKLAFFVFLFSFWCPRLEAQNTIPTQLLSLETVWLRVLEHHPLARNTDLLSQQAEAGIRMARGGFDPKLFSEVESKSFKGTEYFTFSESGLKIPTWYGLELKGVYQTARGGQVSPENILPVNGQAVVGVKLSALRGLIIDERRAALQQAKLLPARNAAEQKVVLNDLLYDVTKAYWEWWAAFQQWQVYQRALENTRQRQSLVVSSFIQGDKPAIDTLESFVQLQDRTIDWQEARLAFRNAGLKLSTFLWEEGEIPLEISENVRPDSLTIQPSDELPFDIPQILGNLENQHPDLRLAQLKISELEIKRRLAAEQLKPRLDLEYNFLGTGFDFTYNNGIDAPIRNLITENYKIGLRFEMPLFLRKERGKLQQTDLKLLESGNSLLQKRQSINNKVLAYYNEWQTTQSQLNLYEQAVANYQRLLAAEVRKFGLGESSIFLINSRENKLIQAELKLIKFQATLPKLESGVRWAAGQLAD